jgi:hypothetical protein
MLKKLTRVTKDYLVECNIDTEDYEYQYTNITHNYTVTGDAAIYSGNFNDVSVNTSIDRDGNSSPK